VLADWKGWLLILLLVAAGYVQGVGTHFEKASGLQRLPNLHTYHLLFRGPAWPFFRWGGIIRIACLAAVLFLFGWRAAVLCGVGVFAFSIALWRATRLHALIMLEQISENIPSNQKGPPSSP
jgi:hypothetical protein